MKRIKKIQHQKNPFLSAVDGTSFYPYPSMTQSLDLLRQSFCSPFKVILVLGDFGSGKSLMMKQFLADEAALWKPCKINPRAMDELAGPRPGKMMREFKAFLYRTAEQTAFMMDDAHSLDIDEVLALLRLTGLAGGELQADKLVLFAEPSILQMMDELADVIAEQEAVDPETGQPEAESPETVKQIAMPRLSRIEAETYILKRLDSVHFNDEKFFTASEMDWIFDESGGYPGGINETAARLFTQKIKDSSRLSMFLKHFF